MPAEPAEDPTRSQPRQSTRARPRRERVATVHDLAAARRAGGTSQRRFARDRGVPRTTLQGWTRRATHADLTPAQQAFFESPDGLAFLHRLMTAALFVMTVLGGLGVALVQQFLVACGLASVVAASATTLRRQRHRVLTATVAWGAAERARLAPAMPPRAVSLTADETWHAGLHLVALDAASGFLLVEQAAAQRDATTWVAAVRTALVGLRATVVQVVGDEAKALVALATDRLGVPKVSDLFHGQREVTRATSGVLAAAVRAATDRHATAAAALVATRAAAQQAATGPRRPGRPADWDHRLACARHAERHAAAQLEVALDHQVGLRLCVRDLGRVLHPVDLPTGALTPAATVGARLTGIFAEVWQRAAACALGTRAQAALAKAQRLVPTWTAAIAWWHREVDARLAACDVDAAVRDVVRTALVPATYLTRVVRRTPGQAARAALQAVIRRTLAPLRAPAGVWAQLPAATRAQLRAVASACADLFQRSTSAVEGRNGDLALYQHHGHALPPNLLAARTVVHNFVLRRADGTTAATRFFGQPHGDLIEHLVATLPVPVRPRRRSRRPREDLLAAVA